MNASVDNQPASGEVPVKGAAEWVGDANAPLDGQLYPQEGVGKDYFEPKGGDVSGSQVGLIGSSDTAYAGFPTGSNYGSYSGMPDNTGGTGGGAVVADFTPAKEDNAAGWAPAESEKPQDYSNGVVAVDSNKNTNPLQIKETD